MKALEGKLAKLLRSSDKGKEALKQFILNGKDIEVTLENGKTYTLSSDKPKPSKALEKRRVQQEIEEGEELYYALIEDELDDECGGWENR